MTHTGPNYLRIKETGITIDKSSHMNDKIGGEAPTNGFKWTDGFNQEHFVKVTPSDPQITIMFPVRDREVRHYSE